MFTVPYPSHLSIRGLGQCNLMEEIGCLTVKCVVHGGGGDGGYQRLIISCVTLTQEQVCQGRGTDPFADYGGINRGQTGEAAHGAAPCKQMPSITALAVSRRSPMTAVALTLSGGLEVERLETPRERGGVDDVHAVLAVVPPVQHDGHHQDRHGDQAGPQARVQRHVVGAVHT